MNGLIASLEKLFVNVPHLPLNAREVLVKVAPYVALLLVIVGVADLFPLLGLGSLYSMPWVWGYGYGWYGGYTLHFIFLAVTTVLWGLAFSGLKARTLQGWQMALYAQLVAVAEHIVVGDLIGAIVVAAVGLYVLFEIKSMYHGGEMTGA